MPPLQEALVWRLMKQLRSYGKLKLNIIWVLVHGALIYFKLIKAKVVHEGGYPPRETGILSAEKTQVVYDVAQRLGLLGSKNLDCTKHP